MEYRLRSTGEVMREGELRAYLRAHGGPSFDRLTDEVMEKIGVDPVYEGARPTPANQYQYPVRAGVTLSGGKYYEAYVLGPVFTEAELAAKADVAYRARRDAEQAAEVRLERNRLLAETDWIMLSDVPQTVPAKQAWVAYRQALRDIPGQEGFPWTITWPRLPEARAR